MDYYENILDAVGRTPLVRLGRIERGEGIRARLLAKVEYLNPAGSVKDRPAVKMLEVAEKVGLLKPGGTVVEPTSGNTGAGLALAAAVKGYNCVCVMPDKTSKEKQELLKALGAEVIVTPTGLTPDDPESYYAVAERLAREIPGGFKPGQYENPANPLAHYETTGPEVWEQTDGRITHFVAGMGTCGTITGTGHYLKEHNPEVRVVGADPEGSIFSDPSNVHTYAVEGVGEDFYPGNCDPGGPEQTFPCLRGGIDEVRHEGHTRRPGAGPGDRRHDSPDLPDLHLHPGSTGPAQRLRVQSHRQPDAHGPRRVRSLPRRRRVRPRLRLWARGDRRDDEPPLSRGPRRRRGRPLRRHLPPLRQGAHPSGRPRVHLRRHHRPGGRGKGSQARDEAALDRDAHQPDAHCLGHSSALGDGARAGGGRGGGQHLRLAVLPDAALSRCGHSRPLDDQVHGRPLRRRRRGRRHVKSGLLREDEVLPERRGRRAGAVRLLDRAPRPENPGRPHAPARGERARGRRVPPGPPGGGDGELPRPPEPPAARARQEADERVLGDGLVHLEGRRGGCLRGGAEDGGNPLRRKPRGGGVPDHPPRHHDPRRHTARAARGEGRDRRPHAPLRRHRGQRRPDRRPGSGDKI